MPANAVETSKVSVLVVIAMIAAMVALAGCALALLPAG